MRTARLQTSSIRDVETVPRGVLRLALPPGLPTRAKATVHRLMVGRLAELSFELCVREDPLAALPDDAHIALSFASRPPEKDFDSITLGAVPLRVLASPDYLARHGPIEDPEALGQHRLLVWTPDARRVESVPMGANRRLSITPTLCSNDGQMLRAMAQAGAGVVYGPDANVPAALLESPGLVRVLPDVVGEDRAFYMVVPTAFRNLPKVKVLLELTAFIQRSAGAR